MFSSEKFESARILENFRRGKGIDIDLTLRQPYFDLLAKLGNPHLKLPPVIHVAGTNGKGSCCAFLRAITEAAGFKAHVYTSPHLVHFHERIRVSGEIISETELIEILKDCERLSPPGEITYFEAATAAAFTVFSRHYADLTILETGLGGRLDATNVIPKPIATIITRISFDHREYLGNTLYQIAREKAGIMRTGIPCFIMPQPSEEAIKSLEKIAAELKTPLRIGGKDWATRIKNESEFIFISKARTVCLPKPALVGEHQIWNAALAISSLETFPFLVSDEALQKAMTTVEWPGRLQKLDNGNLVNLALPKWEIWLDGGHNDSAGEILAQQIKLWKKQKDIPIFVIIGMLSTKDPVEFITPFSPYVQEWRAVPVENEPPGFPPEDLVSLARKTGVEKISATESVEQAILNLAKESSSEEARVLICGSLYLVGDCLRKNR